MACYKRGKVWWYSFVFNGQHVQESTKQSNLQVARQIEAARRTQLAKGEVGIKDQAKREHKSIGQLLDDLKAHYEMHGKASVQNLSLIKTVREGFGVKMADSLTAEDIKDYQRKRQARGYTPSTINNETGLLARAYSLAGAAPPRVDKFETNNARQGFFSREEFERLSSFLPEDLRDFCLFAFLTGMRLGEIQSLVWSNVSDNTIRLRGVDAKTKKPRTIVCSGELSALLKRRQQARSVKTASGVLMASTIFHRNGLPVGEFRKSWTSACLSAQLGVMVCRKCKSESAEKRRCSTCKRARKYAGRIFHDFRRSGVRNLIRAGVPQNVAMRISGHRTDSMFRRYDICNEEDLAQAMLSLEKYHKAEQQRVVSIAK